MSEDYECEKCHMPLPVGKIYVCVHVAIADKPVGDYRLHVECFLKSIRDDSSLFDKMTVIELAKILEEGSES
jgi:hypothetical protein